MNGLNSMGHALYAAIHRTVQLGRLARRCLPRIHCRPQNIISPAIFVSVILTLIYAYNKINRVIVPFLLCCQFVVGLTNFVEVVGYPP